MADTVRTTTLATEVITATEVVNARTTQIALEIITQRYHTSTATANASATATVAGASMQLAVGWGIPIV